MTTNTRLQTLAFITLLMLSMSYTRAETTEPVAPPTPAPAPVVEPQIDRRDIKIPRINVDDMELGPYIGMLNMDDFGSQFSYGIRGVYHVSEDFFVEGAYGESHVSASSFHEVGIPVFEATNQKLTQYSVSAGYNLFPGEIFLSRGRAVNSIIYVIGGLGIFSFGSERYTSFNAGFGVNTVPYESMTIRVDIRDYMFQSNLLGTNELKHNVELSCGASWYF